jgi:hypothetical protein
MKSLTLAKIEPVRKLALIMQSDLNISISIAIQEMTMSQRTQQDEELRRAETQRGKKPEKPITGLSPDDDVGVKSDDTGKPGAPIK